MGPRAWSQSLLLCSRSMAVSNRSGSLGLPASWWCPSSGDGPTKPCTLHAANTNTRGFQSSSALHSQQATNISTSEILGLMFSPTQIGVQAMEWSHAATGLPWWASIPAAAVAAKLSLLPLSMKAKQARAHFQVFDTAVAQAKALAVDLPQSDRRALESSKVAWMIYRYSARKAGLPSLWWYWGNAGVQAAAFLTFTGALNSMSTAVWTGFTSEGPPGLRDLSSPPVFLSTLSTPFGTMGAVVPLMCVLAYTKAVDASPLSTIPGFGVALRVMAAPYYCLSLLQPHATLLYWLTHTLSCWAIQAYSKAPVVPVPASKVQGGADEADEDASGSLLDVDLLLSLGRQLSAQKGSMDAAVAAVVCYQRAVQQLEQQIGSDDDDGADDTGADREDGQEALLEQAKEALDKAKERRSELS